MNYMELLKIIVIGIVALIVLGALGTSLLLGDVVTKLSLSTETILNSASAHSNGTISPFYVFSSLKNAKGAIMKIGQTEIMPKIATTDEQRQLGFMNTNCTKCAIIFAFPAKNQYEFWMKNVSMELAILGFEPIELNVSAESKTVDYVFEVSSIGEMYSCKGDACPTYTLGSEYSVYVELPKIFFEQSRLKKGDRIQIRAEI